MKSIWYFCCFKQKINIEITMNKIFKEKTLEVEMNPMHQPRESLHYVIG